MSSSNIPAGTSHRNIGQPQFTDIVKMSLRQLTSTNDRGNQNSDHLLS